MDYTGEKCVYCGKTFTEDDDIVVCPECGSPHHRECYKIENKCANSLLHAEGKKWESELAKNHSDSAETAFAICPACHFPNKKTNEKCVQCGHDLASHGNFSGSAGEESGVYDTEDKNSGFGIPRQYLGFDPNEDMGGATLKELSQFVGTNTIYYIPIFKRMKDIGTKISFNLSCFLFPPLYFANRRMWVWAICTTLLGIFLNIPALIFFMAENGYFNNHLLDVVYNNQHFIENLQEIFGFFEWGTHIALSLFGNWIYFRYSIKAVRKIKSHSHDGVFNPDLAVSMGGVKPINIIVISLITCFFAMAAMLGITLMLDAVIILS